MILELVLLAAQAERPAPAQPAPVELGSAGVLAAMENELQALHRELRPALVQVHTRYAWSDEKGGTREEFLTVSGIVIAEGGYVVAPGHLGGENRGLRIIDRQNRGHEAHFLAQAEHLGLSLLKADSLSVRVPALGCAEAMPVGSLTISLGNGLGLEGSMDHGILSGRGRQIAQVDGLMQITNNINLGDGGGLVANRSGQIIGILFTSLEEAARRYVAKSDSKGLDLTTSRGVGFAIPIDRVIRAFQPYLPTSLAGRREMGVHLNPEPVSLNLPDFRNGFRVVQVVPDSAAFHAGLQRDDVLLRVGDTPCATLECLAVSLARAGTNTPIWVLRGDKKMQVQMTFRAIDGGKGGRRLVEKRFAVQKKGQGPERKQAEMVEGQPDQPPPPEDDGDEHYF